MLRFLTYLFAGFYLIASFQITINLHYCHNDLVAVSLFGETNCGAHEDGKVAPPCCSNEQISISLEEEQQHSKWVNPPVQNWVYVALILEELPISVIRTTSECLPDSRAGPPLKVPSKLYRLYQVDQLYA